MTAFVRKNIRRMFVRNVFSSCRIKGKAPLVWVNSQFLNAELRVPFYDSLLQDSFSPLLHSFA
jgi:hypothetical protein